MCITWSNIQYQQELIAQVQYIRYSMSVVFLLPATFSLWSFYSLEGLDIAIWKKTLSNTASIPYSKSLINLCKIVSIVKICSNIYWTWINCPQKGNHGFSDEHKQDHLKSSKDGSQLFQYNLQEFRRSFVAVDKIWLYYYTSEKVIATVSCDCQGIMFVSNLKNARTITNEYNASLLK